MEDENSYTSELEMEIQNSIQKQLKIMQQPLQLTMQLICQSTNQLNHLENRFNSFHYLRNIDTESEQIMDANQQEIAIDKLLENKILRLGWLNIQAIENLDVFTQVTELHLQHNLIKRIERLDNLHQLNFLALHGNQIKKVENIKHLTNLKFLDLSNNLLEDFEIQEFPKSLRVLRLAGNPFIRHMPSYVSLFFERIPSLQQIDQFRRTGIKEHQEGCEDYMLCKCPLVYKSRSKFVDFESDVINIKMMDQNVQDDSQTSQVGVDQHITSASESNGEFSIEIGVKASHRLPEPKIRPLDISFDEEGYMKAKSIRHAEWKSRTKELESHGEESALVFTQLEEAAKEKRRLRKDRIQLHLRETESVLEASRSYFETMEIKHKDWREKHLKEIETL